MHHTSHVTRHAHAQRIKIRINRMRFRCGGGGCSGPTPLRYGTHRDVINCSEIRGEDYTPPSPFGLNVAESDGVEYLGHVWRVTCDV